MTKKKLFLLVTLTITAGLTLVTAAQAADTATSNWLTAIGIPEGQFIPKGCTDTNNETHLPLGPCGLDQVFQVIINFTQILLALTGSVAILMFVYGGTMMIVSGTNIKGSGDNKKTINRGKDAIYNAVFGLIIILGAWLVVNFTILAITGGKIGTTAQIFGRNFNQTPSGFNTSFERGNTSAGSGNGVNKCDDIVPPSLCEPICGNSGVESMQSTGDGNVCCVCKN